MARPREDGIQSLHRAFDILALVSRFDVVGATQIATTLDLPVSTVNNLCRTMAARGYLLGRRGRYRIGPAFSTITSHWNPMVALPEEVVPVLRALSSSIGQAAVATVLVGMDLQVIAFEPGHGPVGTPPPRSNRNALDLTSGTVMVALTRRGQWEKFIDQCRTDAEHPIEADILRAELDEVSRTNICGRRSSNPHGQTAIAVPVWAAAGAVACAIGVAAPTYLVDEPLVERIWNGLVDATAGLSRELGATEAPSVSRAFSWGETH